jgi:hypothetical protein
LRCHCGVDGCALNVPASPRAVAGLRPIARGATFDIREALMRKRSA